MRIGEKEWGGGEGEGRGREEGEEVLSDSGRALLVPFSWAFGCNRWMFFGRMTEEKRNDVQLHF
jgi:hypothetical protein